MKLGHLVILRIGRRRYTKSLRSLRQVRDGECHYVLDKESTSVMDCYWSVLLEKLQNLSPDLKKLFNKSYSVGFVDYIIQHLKSKGLPCQLLDEERAEIEEWFRFN